jgi:heptosyltransferase I
MKIAIVKLSALGDIVHAMTVIQFIKKYDQKIKIDWVVEECFAGLLDCHPDIENIHTVSIKKAKKKKSLFLLIKELRSVRKFGSYDLVIDMQGLIKSAVISRLIPSPITVGFDKSSIRENIASIFYNQTFQYSYAENVIERNVALMAFALELNFDNKEIQYKFPFLYSSQKYSNIGLSDFKKNIVLIPGASHQSKCYPTASLAKLATLIDANFLVIWGDLKEKILAEEIKILAPNVSICEKLTIDSLKSLISQVDLVIGPDTGPTHIAWALNVASITLFGPTPGYRNSYVTKINRIIESDSKVNPHKMDRNDNSIRDIDVQGILQVSKDLLSQS